MIKVAFIAAKLKTGGAERQWYELIKGMDRKRFDITVLCLYELGELGERIAGLGVKCRSGILKSRFSFFAIPKLKNILLQEKIDVVFLWNQPLTMLYAIPAAKMAGIGPIIGVIHNTGHVERQFRVDIFNRACVRFLTKVVVLGTNHRSYAIQKEHVPADKATIIFNGVEMKDYDLKIDREKKKEELGIPRAAKVVGIIARLHIAKRHDIFLKAAQRVLAEEKNTCFVIVGDGEEKDKIKRLIGELGLGQSVKMLGLRKDVAEINRVLDVAVLCSDPVVETLPMTIIESMAASVPVVATNVGSLSDMVIDGENGFLVEAGDTQALAGAILKLLRDGGLAARMGEKGHAIASEKFSRAAMVKGYEDLFTLAMEAA